GYTTRRRDIDDRWQLLLEFARLAESVKPEIITLENVPRLVRLPIWTHLLKQLESAGYNLAWGVIDAADYGVPQSRRRVVLLGSTLGSIQLPLPRRGRQLTVQDAIGDLPEVKAGERGSLDPLHAARSLMPVNLKRIRASKPAGTWKQWPEAMRA